EAETRDDAQRVEVAPYESHRGGQGRRAHEGHLPRRAVRSAPRPPWVREGYDCRRPLHPRRRLLHPGARPALPGSRPRLLPRPPLTPPSPPPPRAADRSAGLQGQRRAGGTITAPPIFTYILTTQK